MQEDSAVNTSSIVNTGALRAFIPITPNIGKINIPMTNSERHILEIMSYRLRKLSGYPAWFCVNLIKYTEPGRQFKPFIVIQTACNRKDTQAGSGNLFIAFV